MRVLIVVLVAFAYFQVTNAIRLGDPMGGESTTSELPLDAIHALYREALTEIYKPFGRKLKALSAILPPVDVQGRWRAAFPNRLSRFTDEVPRRFIRDDKKVYPASFWFRG